MILPVKYKSDNDFYNKYISLFQWELKLTERELQILVSLIEDLIDIIKTISKEYPDKFLFDSKNIIPFCKKNNLSINQYHNIKNSLIEKKAIFRDPNGDLKINRLLIPKKEIGFKFDKYE